MREMNMEHCLVCGSELDYFSNGKELICAICGKTELANIQCTKEHYVCNVCHDKSAFDLIRDYGLTTKQDNPFEIAEFLMDVKDKVPMLGCSNAWIATAAFMAALRNYGAVNISDDSIVEALNRTNRQAIGGYCGLTGVCGIAPAIGASFSVILGAACKKDKETATTMRIVGNVVHSIANEAGPCCCKNFVRTALEDAVRFAEEEFDFKWEMNKEAIICTHSARHPHGCRTEKCRFYQLS